MSFIESRLAKLIIFSSLLLAFFACTKITNTDIGSGLIPPVDGVNTKDTILEIETKNAGVDTTAVGISDNHVLGFVHDFVFGSTIASINFQVSAPTYPLKLDTNVSSVTIDSVVLCLSYKGVWGDTTQESAVRVFQMDNETLFTADSLYRTSKLFEKGIEITELTAPAKFTPRYLNDPDTIKQFNEVADNTLRIRLNNSFGQQLINQTGSTVYTNDSTFHNFLRGIMVVPEQTGNSLLQISLVDTSTRLTLYYHYPKTTSGDSATSRRFAVSATSSASSNTILRDYTGAQISGYVPGNLNTQDDLLFIQTSPGSYARLKIPGLDSSFPNVIVHRSEILMSQVPSSSSLEQYITSPNLFIAAYSKDSSARFAVPNDIDFSSGVISNLTSFGVLPIKKGNLSTYSFDITRYTQGIIAKNEPSYDLILWAPYNYYLRPTETVPAATPVYVYPIASPALNNVAIGRVMLGGGNNFNSNYRMKLHIVYSPIK